MILRLLKLLAAGHEVMLTSRHRPGKTEAGGPLGLASLTPFVNSRFAFKIKVGHQSVRGKGWLASDLPKIAMVCTPSPPQLETSSYTLV